MIGVTAAAGWSHRRKHCLTIGSVLRAVHHALGRDVDPLCKTNVHKYRGVYRRHNGAFQAKLMVQGDMYHLGTFNSAIKAAEAYDQGLRNLCADDVIRLKRSLNFPTTDEAAYAETALQARGRGLARNGGTLGSFCKETQAFKLLKEALVTSPVSKHYEVRRLSGSSKADALFVLQIAPEAGLPLQLKAASARGRLARMFCFHRTRGYEGMLVVCLALEGGHIWMEAGQRIATNTLSIRLGCESNLQRRVRQQDLGQNLVACFHNKLCFPHLSVAEASMQCGARTHRVEALAHLQLEKLFCCARMRLTRPDVHNSTVDSHLELKAAGGLDMWLRVQEKARNESGNWEEQRIMLGKHGGALGKLPYGLDDFDLLTACILKENQLQGLFLIPMAVLANHGFVGVAATSMRLYPPWKPPPVREAAKARYGWQADFFLDLRSWQGSNKPSSEQSQKLEKLVTYAAASVSAKEGRGSSAVVAL